MKLELDEYDGTNERFECFFLVATLDMLMRGYSVSILTHMWKINIDIPNLYKLHMHLPLDFDLKESRAFFDCKWRLLAIALPLAGLTFTNQEEPLPDNLDQPEQLEPTEELPSEPSAPEPVPSTDIDSNSMLFDII